MQLSDGEKLILMMLCDLYDKNEIEGEIDHTFVRDAIFENQTWALPWKFSGIPFKNTETPRVVKKVLDILDMWRVIEYSYSELTEEEKKKLKENVELFGKKPIFKGFDGNNETEYLAAADFVINKLDRFEEFKLRDLNSHMPSLATYERMMHVFNPLFHENFGEPLTLEQLTLVLREKIHPSRR
ncbi:YfbU family protein [Escherichia coli]|uniref:YfbU family protein n=1 Tax=Escherichia coli TaxID=562 RepID=UPI000BE5EBC9|nr:YfbU family protein [Escherichia coli]EHW5634432.1 YfbU family protein [Escherichia coli]EII2916907.1 YfbU family protein [Escherichia coli]EKF3357202.1 YfbU family protein [Escherichia coli]ELK0522525.1 YfbU family protein [Escherichia coli]MBB7679570.1 YfbU family protein [Escherichia coli]